MPENPFIILTRAPEDNPSLAARLKERGYRVVEYPCIKTVSTAGNKSFLRREAFFKDYDVIIFTSRRAVWALEKAGIHLKGSGSRFASVGRKTASEIQRTFGQKPWLTAEPPTGETLARSLVQKCRSGQKLLYLRGNKSTGILASILNRHGLKLDEIIVYEHQILEKNPLDLNSPGIAVIASPSAADCFLRYNADSISRLVFLAIGPTTAGHLKNHGISGTYQAENPDSDSLFNKIAEITRIHNFKGDGYA